VESYTIRVLGGHDTAALRAMLGLFGEAFEEHDTYLTRQPDDEYLRRLLRSEEFVAVAAFSGSQVVGGLAAYVLPKFEQPRNELYIYDLAVKAPFRRLGLGGAYAMASYVSQIELFPYSGRNGP